MFFFQTQANILKMEIILEKEKSLVRKFSEFLGEHGKKVYFVPSYNNEVESFQIDIFPRIKKFNSQEYFTENFGAESRRGFKELGKFCRKNNVAFVRY